MLRISARSFGFCVSGASKPTIRLTWMFMSTNCPVRKCRTAVSPIGHAIKLRAQATRTRRAGVHTTPMRSQKITKVLRYMLCRNARLPPGHRERGTIRRAHAPSASAIKSSRGGIVKGWPRLNRSTRCVTMPSTAAISPIRSGASAGNKDCGARNRMTVRAMRAQKGAALGCGADGSVGARLPGASPSSSDDARHQPARGVSVVIGRRAARRVPPTGRRPRLSTGRNARSALIRHAARSRPRSWFSGGPIRSASDSPVRRPLRTARAVSNRIRSSSQNDLCLR